ncbi:uncharacterized protein LOC107268957 isoform X2 [Cephus cinctus]|uniref:Uncharacterized protein LOC107268957 isoform X2 n=1 Tax=Cephus cinctus TaxID=211228 RepID=A0AAJ7W2F0_CEPCN|nr:uncharacterized protein LOC107268957 isoform X2 [Cephus cinctus]
MRNSKQGVVLLVMLVLTGVATSHRHYRHRHPDKGDPDLSINAHADIVSEKNDHPQDVSVAKKTIKQEDTSSTVPISTKRFEKMLQKAILKIITGDLSTGDMLLLKSLNYSLDEVLAIRERELNRKLIEKERKSGHDEIWRGGNKDNRKKDPSRKFEKPLEEYDYLARYGDDTRNQMETDYEDAKEVKGRKKELSTDNKRPYESRNFDLDPYNRQDVLHYETPESRMDNKQSWGDGTVDYEDSPKDLEPKESLENPHVNFDRAMEPHVVFKIRYDDSEFDSNSDERVKSQEITENVSTMKNPDSTFHFVDNRSGPSLPIVYRLGQTARPGEHHEDSAITTEGYTVSTANVQTQFSSIDKTSQTSGHQVLSSYTTAASTDNVRMDLTTGSNHQDDVTENPMKIHNDSSALENFEKSTKNFTNSSRNSTEYEGLEWVEDDVYRVIPEAMELVNYDVNDTVASDYYEQNSSYQNLYASVDYADYNETMGYQKDMPDAVRLFMANANVTLDNDPTTNVTSYQEMMMAHRRDQGQKAIEDIKLRVLALTGRFNLSTSLNQVQRERLTMFSPSCQIPRNTDPEAWADPFLMNMHFQLNLTSTEHVVAAKLRLFKLPQDNLTVITGNVGTTDEDEEDEKKIRISIYFYTKSLKKHRSKKRLIDSVVTPLTSEGSHLALDVRQSLRFWQLRQRNGHGNGNNHGIVVQIEDQDGRPLKPAEYIQQPSCHTAEDDADDKAYQRQPALFVRACSRYVRVVNGETVTYVDCRSSQHRKG